MYACGIACCPLVSHSEYADGSDGTDRRTDARPLSYAFLLDEGRVTNGDWALQRTGETWLQESLQLLRATSKLSFSLRHYG